MKKVLSLLMMLVILGSNLCASASTGVTIDEYYDSPIDKTYTITPNIQVFEPGAICVEISWVAPQLTFQQKSRLGDEARYYALRSESSAIFNVINKSRPSSTENGFDGNINVTAETVVYGTEPRANIVILLAESGKVIPIVKGATFSGFKLSYANRADANIKDYLLSEIITADKTPNEIRDIMSVNIRFYITH